MSNAWDIAKQMAERHSSSIFVRLVNDGDKVVGVFVGEPLAREVVWTGERYLDVEHPDAEKYLNLNVANRHGPTRDRWRKEPSA